MAEIIDFPEVPKQFEDMVTSLAKLLEEHGAALAGFQGGLAEFTASVEKAAHNIEAFTELVVVFTALLKEVINDGKGK